MFAILSAKKNSACQQTSGTRIIRAQPAPQESKILGKRYDDWAAGIVKAKVLPPSSRLLTQIRPP